MSGVNTLQLLAAALFFLAGVLNIARAPRYRQGTRAKNARLSGWLMLFTGALFLILALGIV